ncbi:hypothetical protein [Nocardioides taihuensis]|uniref:Uncharacterized protein n=1 Tax=Nocardioides taihuensis TaxID=1835606 RepID=A0ABW0BG58_9ACTN
MNSLPPQIAVIIARQHIDEQVRAAAAGRRAHHLRRPAHADAAPQPWWRRFLPAGRPLPGATLPPAVVASG